MITRGDILDIENKMPGTPDSGLKHHAFAVSEPFGTESGQSIVLMSTTTGSRNQVREPFACFMKDASQCVYEQGRPFEFNRPVTPTQLFTVLTNHPTTRVGFVREGFFTGAGCNRSFGAIDTLSVQLQFPDRLACLSKLYRSPRDLIIQEKENSPARGSIWSVRGRPNLWMLISNDTSNDKTAFVSALRIVEGPGGLQVGPTQYKIEGSIIMARKAGPPGSLDTLDRKVLPNIAQNTAVVDAHLTRLFHR